MDLKTDAAKLERMKEADLQRVESAYAHRDASSIKAEGQHALKKQKVRQQGASIAAASAKNPYHESIVLHSKNFMKATGTCSIARRIARSVASKRRQQLADFASGDSHIA